jgi:hypothetical protein
MVIGDSTMKKPDFDQMSRLELRTYILANREDDDAIEALIKRADPNSPIYPYPQTEEDLKHMQEILQQRLLKDKDAA